MSGIVEDLQKRYPKLRIIKDGRMQMTLFKPAEFIFTQVLVSVDGVFIFVEPSTPISTVEIGEAFCDVTGARRTHGPFPLEDPTMFSKIYEVIDEWLGQSSKT